MAVNCIKYTALITSTVSPNRNVLTYLKHSYILVYSTQSTQYMYMDVTALSCTQEFHWFVDLIGCLPITKYSILWLYKALETTSTTIDPNRWTPAIFYLHVTTLLHEMSLTFHVQIELPRILTVPSVQFYLECGIFCSVWWTLQVFNNLL